ncbi:hypothetical protein BBJ28_00025600 [Nothophytophthora sp. Chile5]|nr:hypothetical protein BBJ28_00025600 [Nothophytophthora sp. Chile5]
MAGPEEHAGSSQSRWPSPLMAAGALDSVHILEDFLQEMNELDHQQQPSTGTLDGPKRQKREKEKTAEVAPQPQKKMKTGCMKGLTPRENPSWRRRKQELQSLREQTQVLETRVAFLQLQRTREMDARTDLPEGQKMWKVAALDERQRRQEAQDENTRMKSQLQTYIRISEALKTALTAAQAQCKDRSTNSAIVARSIRMQLGTGQRLQFASSSTFDMFESRVNARFLEIRAIFGELQHSVAWQDSEQVQIFRDNSDDSMASVRFTNTRMLPFDEGTISDVLWGIIALGGIPDKQSSRVTRRSKDVFALDCRYTVAQECGGSVTLDVHGVIKRFVTSEGLFFIVESSSEWLTNPVASGTVTHATQETGCFMVRGCAVVATSTTATPHACRIRSVLHLRPSEPTEQACRPPLDVNSRAMSEFVIPSFREIINTRHQFVENALLDSTRCH